jgi:hypothetical protein
MHVHIGNAGVLMVHAIRSLLSNKIQHVHMYTGQAGERIGNTVWCLYLTMCSTCRWGSQPENSAKVPDHFRNGKSPSSLCPHCKKSNRKQFIPAIPLLPILSCRMVVINISAVYMVLDVYDFDAGKSISRAHLF